MEEATVMARHCPICLEEFFAEDNASHASYGSIDIDLEAGGGGSGGGGVDNNAVAVEGCGHAFCHSCMLQSITLQVGERVVPPVCPMAGCKILLGTDWVVEKILNADEEDGESGKSKQDKETQNLIDKLLQLGQLGLDSSMVECVRCQRVFSSDNTAGGNDLRCPRCDHVFCHLHGDAHPEISCSKWLKSQDGRRVKKTEMVMKRLTKPCPHCGAFIQKIDGCNHVHCQGCLKHMCWRCGDDYGGSNVNRNGEHVCPPHKILCGCFPAWLNIFGCLPSWVARLVDVLFVHVMCFFLVVALFVLSIAWTVIAIPIVLLCGCCLFGICCHPKKWRPGEGCVDAFVFTCFPFLYLLWPYDVEEMSPTVTEGFHKSMDFCSSNLCCCCKKGDSGVAEFPVMEPVSTKSNK